MAPTIRFLRAAIAALPACLASRLVPASSRQLPPPVVTRRAGLLTLSGGAAADSRLAEIRAAMAEAGVDAFVVPSNDPHLSEYVHPHYERRAFISGFTGSAGTALITADAALLWTDGRYFLQAEQELGADWTLMRSLTPGVPTLENWLAEQLADGQSVGIDPYVHSVDEATTLEKALEKAGRGLALKLLYSRPNLVDAVWAGAEALGLTPRPPPPSSEARINPLEVAGKSAAEKLADMAKAAGTHGAGAYLVAMLDEVAWLLNVRGTDVPMCPVLQSYVFVDCAAADAVTATLFVDEAKLPPAVQAALAEAGVAFRPYESVEGAVREAAAAGVKILLDPKGLNYGLREAAGAAAVLQPSPIANPKAVKNEHELDGMIDAHLTDGASLAAFFAWLEKTVVDEATPITEVELATRLEAFRARGDGFLELSFPTICGNGPNGAVIHYNPLAAPPAQVQTIDGSQVVLLDSGAQYRGGTTDVTRTFHLGTPSAWEREIYTRVLKGNIGLDTLVFPADTPGMAIDAFARAALWSAGLDYLHGTGHGVGAALNVHEGPISISARYANTNGLKAGMVVSNEPGFYEAGGFGVRIENLLIIREVPGRTDGKSPPGLKPFLSFEQLTHVPIQKKMVEPSLLTPAEVAWLDGYHERVWQRVSPRLEDGSDAKRWLRDATLPLDVPASAPAVGPAAAAAAA